MGQKICVEKLDSWLGAVGYLSLLDQVGKNFKPQNATVAKGNSIERALIYFTHLDICEISAIYALHCGFARDFSLININSLDPFKQHHFALSSDIEQIVLLPQSQWNGKYQDKSMEKTRTVNLEYSGDMVEDIVHKIWSLFNEDALQVMLKGGIDELIKRYFVGDLV